MTPELQSRRMPQIFAFVFLPLKLHLLQQCNDVIKPGASYHPSPNAQLQISLSSRQLTMQVEKTQDQLLKLILMIKIILLLNNDKIK